MVDTDQFRINRKLFENEIWLKERFTFGQAWIDLIGNANYKEGSFFIRGIKVNLKRGQIAWSIRFMMKRWRWSQVRVERFIKYLKLNTQINTQNTKLVSLITILNYGFYQKKPEEINTQVNTETNTQTNTIQKESIYKERKETLPKYSKIEDIGKEDIKAVAELYGVPLKMVEDRLQDLKDYCLAKGVGYQNYLAALRNFVRREMKEVENRKPIQKKTVWDNIT